MTYIKIFGKLKNVRRGNAFKTKKGEERQHYWIEVVVNKEFKESVDVEVRDFDDVNELDVGDLIEVTGFLRCWNWNDRNYSTVTARRGGIEVLKSVKNKQKPAPERPVPEKPAPEKPAFERPLSKQETAEKFPELFDSIVYKGVE